MAHTDNVRVRFAPSPTGQLHIGNLRSAMFNWLFARHHGGAFLLRIEDTDYERSKQSYIDYLLESLKWCGIDYDESPLIQSSRVDVHKNVINTLIDEGKAYRCFCSQDEIDERQNATGKKLDLFAGYDGFCRDKQQHGDNSGKPFVVRFKLPEDRKEVMFDDLIRGSITFGIDQLDDFIIARSDGSPVYNLVVVIDDAFMDITHIIRGEDHISNTPKQILLYEACGYNVPQFAHIPLILGSSGDKLSKRDAAVSVLEYKKEGYLADALFNYLVRLGWSHGDQEVFSKKELVQFFSLDHVGKKGAIFDVAKLLWLNGVYIRELSAQKLLEHIEKDLDLSLRCKLERWDEQKICTLLDLYKERAKTLKELECKLVEFYDGPQTFEEESMDRWIGDQTVEHIQKLVEQLDGLKDFSAESIAHCIKDLCKDLGIKLVALAQPIRIALTGTSASPGVFELLALVGKEESIQRLLRLLKVIK